MAAAVRWTVDSVLYRTHSFCLWCMIAERKGIEWKDASVVERGDNILLVCEVYPMTLLSRA